MNRMGQGHFPGILLMKFLWVKIVYFQYSQTESDFLGSFQPIWANSLLFQSYLVCLAKYHEVLDQRSFLRSQNILRVNCFLFIASPTFFSKLIIGWIVECLDWNPCWFGWIMLRVLQYFDNFIVTIFSRIVEKTGSRETGL